MRIPNSNFLLFFCFVFELLFFSESHLLRHGRRAYKFVSHLWLIALQFFKLFLYHAQKKKKNLKRRRFFQM